jgi:hypothetical protein
VDKGRLQPGGAFRRQIVMRRRRQGVTSKSAAAGVRVAFQ